METKVRIRVRDIEVDVTGEEEFVINRLPNLISDLISRLDRASVVHSSATGNELISISGDIRDYWTGAPVSGAQVVTVGLASELIGRSDEAGRFIMARQSAGERCILVVSALQHVETAVPVDLSAGPITISVAAIAIADIDRQHTIVGIVRESDTTIVIIDLLDGNGAPLEMVPVTNIMLTASNGLFVGSGPYFFGASGDIEPQALSPISRAFNNRARAAFINVPKGEFTLQVIGVGAENRLAQVSIPLRAVGGATIIQAKLSPGPS